MLVDISKLSVGDVRDISFSENVVLPNTLGLLDVHSNVSFSGVLTALELGFSFSGELSASLLYPCSLCLAPVSIDIHVDFSEKYSDDDSSDEDFWGYTGKKIDFLPSIIDNIILNLPMKSLCSPDCKGLCNECGKNLNNGHCDCKANYINPNFAALSSIFDDKEV